MSSFQKKLTYQECESNTFDIKLTKFKPWLICIIASMFFLYEFIQVNMFNSIDSYIVKDFGLTSTQLGFLSSIYFYSTVGFILPAGQLLDLFSPKKIILLTLFICVGATVGFALSDNLIISGICRFLEGIGSAFCFLGTFRIAANWFDKTKLSLLTGVIMTIGMLGGVLAQTPLTVLVQQFGWREALLIDAGCGAILGIAILLLVYDSPHKKNFLKQNKKLNYLSNLKMAYKSKNNWACGIYTCLMNLPMALLGALWGGYFLTQVHFFSQIQASFIVTQIFIGTIVGAPLFGFIAQYNGTRKYVMATNSLISIFLMIYLITTTLSSYPFFICLFFLIGFFSSSQILGYPTAAQNNKVELSAMCASVVSFTTMSGYIIFQPLFGWLIGNLGSQKISNGIVVYSHHSYQYALLLIPTCMLIAFIATFFIRSPISE